MNTTTVIHGYTVILEHEPRNGWGAYAPDLPGLGVGGRTRQEVEQMMHEGIPFHIEALKEKGLEVPPPGNVG